MKSKDAWKRRIGILLILLMAITTVFDNTALFAESSESGSLGNGAVEQGKSKKEKNGNNNNEQRNRERNDPFGWEEWEWDHTDPHDLFPNWDEMTYEEQWQAWLRWRISRLLDPTVSPEPTGTPEPTGDIGPTEDPHPTEGAEPTEDPEPTEGAEPTGTPEPTEGAEPTEDPQPTGSVDPTGTPEPTGDPEPTQTPVPTADPQPTVILPLPTAGAEPTENPQPTEAPVPTEAPQPTVILPLPTEDPEQTQPVKDDSTKKTDAPPSNSPGFGAVSIKGMTLDELAQLLLTEEELALYNSGVELTVEVKLVDITSIVNEEIRNIIKSSLPEGYKEGVYFSAALIKQLAGSDAVRVLGENTIRVAFEIPEAIRSVTKTAEATKTNSYRLYKVYSNQNGNSDIEEVEVAIYDEYTMEADIDTSEDAEYVIIYDATVPAGNGEIQNDSENDGEQDVIITGTGENAHVFTSETLVEDEPEITEEQTDETFVLSEKVEVVSELKEPNTNTGQKEQSPEISQAEQEDADSEKGFVIFNILLAVITLVLVGLAYASRAEYKRFQRVITIVCAVASSVLTLLTMGFSYIAAADLWTIVFAVLATISAFALTAKKLLKK